ncbi:hypothetical protein [Arcobacter roscoffensis]|uniref:Uncharacterized protein n=1 Tax=Arcobacter roscoffensis TaxID=2961520 RepID=A0ABY5E286_9BACT|nr:hypothetical protein [Arcobacter roscoffensis]UTJ06304.1 hypothetical protein NJU99_13770 [Arcobacter roscoffensis]|tara:strand:- start:463 stop:648 length:186 start_codon:yes stop_codon:yes gene_type:complete
MNYDLYLEDILVSDESQEIVDSQWIQENSQVVDSNTYNVYQGTGQNSLVKIFINEEIVVDL